MSGSSIQAEKSRGRLAARAFAAAAKRHGWSDYTAPGAAYSTENLVDLIAAVLKTAQHDENIDPAAIVRMASDAAGLVHGAAPGRTIYRATLGTRNFDFDAYGETEEEARAAILGALRVHGEECGIGPDWVTERGFGDSIEVHAEPLGVGQRDGQALFPRPAAKGGAA